MQVRKITYRLYPSKAQSARLADLLYLHKNLYNAALEERISAYRKAGLSLNYNDQSASLTLIRDEHPDYKSANSSALQQTLRRLDKAFAHFFRRIKKGQTPGFPRFKSITRFPGICYGSYNHGKSGWGFTPGKDWNHGRLRLSDVGTLKCRGKARTGGDIKTADLLYRRGHWHLSLSVECEPVRQCQGNAVMAFDWGTESLLSRVSTDGTREKVENPRWFQQYKEHKAALQRSLATKKRFGRAWKQIKKKLAALESAIARRRLDFQHKVSAEFARKYAVVVAEELNIRNMTRSAKGTVEKPGKNVRQKSGLNREIIDTAPAQLYGLIRYKVQETDTGIWLDAPTRKLKPSQRCPVCLGTKRKTLNERVHQCEDESCGYTDDRDYASALVCLRYALAWLAGQELAWAALPPETLSKR